MARQPVESATLRGWRNVLENNFTGGLKTEFTGLNFPENSCTATSNCTFFHTGAVFRRNGFDYESGFTINNINRTNSAISTFIWTNAGGDGSTKLYVVQIGLTIYFYQLTNSTITNPLSTTLLASTVSLSGDPTVECQFSTGNGYLFIFKADQDPSYCTFTSGVISSNAITVLIRDFVGTGELVLPGPDTYRPTTLSNYHQYNLQNQGWTNQAVWSANSSSKVLTTSPVQYPIGLVSFQVQAGLSGVNLGQSITIVGILSAPGFTYTLYASGLVNAYSGTTLTLNVTSSTAVTGTPPPLNYSLSSTISPANAGGQIAT
ncbi:MAG TPA: hypothetical protein VNZ45_14490, partial [Bacteroidia bacterium]|nr:hypothetical protein [Bacteroidia bacterium]